MTQQIVLRSSYCFIMFKWRIYFFRLNAECINKDLKSYLGMLFFCFLKFRKLIKSSKQTLLLRCFFLVEADIKHNMLDGSRFAEETLDVKVKHSPE